MQMKNTDIQSDKRIFVKVFGFTDAERHALSTAFVLSASSHTTYAMWSADVNQRAQLAFLDGDSWEASLAMANPEHDALKLLWVGSRPPATAWQVFQRPLKWAAIIEALDSLYGPLQALPETGGVADEIDFDLGFDIPPQAADNAAPDEVMDFGPDTEPQALADAGPDEPVEARKRILVIDSDRATRLYWRAKLATAGHLLVDEAATGEEALKLVRFHVYTLVILDMDLTDVSSWALFKMLQDSTPSITHLILTGQGLTLWDKMRAWFAHARGTLRKPLHPGKVKQLLESL